MMLRAVHAGLGANLPSHAGRPLETLRRAIDAIGRLPLTAVSRVSGAYRTEPLGPPQPEYINAAIAIRTALGVAELMGAFLAIERRFGRRRAAEARWGPRPLDLDLLVDGESVIDSSGLAVPHPRMCERAFVLVPLDEIAPNLVIPIAGVTVRSLVRSLLVATGRDAVPGVTRVGDLR